MNKEYLNAANTKKVRERIIPIAVGVTLGIVLGAAMDNIALGLVIGIILGGLVVIWKKRK